MNTKPEVITVATHNEGYLNKLINNKYTKVKVLGFGKKWTGYRMKSQLIYSYIKDLPDDKIIIFVDGFDSIINGNINKAINIFKKNKYKLLFSSGLPDNSKKYTMENIKNTIIKKTITDSIFKECRNSTIIVCSMYMGYVKYLKIFLKKALEFKCKDDQVVFNNICSNYNFIDLDYKQQIFKNISFSKYHKTDKNNKQIFLSYPGKVSINRYYRGLFEYSQFFIKIWILLLFLLILFLYKKNRFNSIYATIILFSLFIYNIDNSCIYI